MEVAQSKKRGKAKVRRPPWGGGRGPADAFLFERLLDEYGRRIFNVVYGILGDYDEAADCTQEAFVKAYESLHTFRGDSQLYTWLYRIAVNLAKNRLRDLRRRRRREAFSLDEPLALDEEVEKQLSAGELTPEELAEKAEMQEVVRRAIATLPYDLRVALVLRELDGLSYAEIAEVVGASVEAVKARVFRARRMLKERLRPFIEALDRD